MLVDGGARGLSLLPDRYDLLPQWIRELRVDDLTVREGDRK